jgi:hypothetical protein
MQGQLLALDEQHRAKISELMSDVNTLQRELQAKSAQLEAVTRSDAGAGAAQQLNLRDLEAQAARIQRLEQECGKLTDTNRQLRYSHPSPTATAAQLSSNLLWDVYFSESLASASNELKLKDEELRGRAQEGSKWASQTQTLETEKNTFER